MVTEIAFRSASELVDAYRRKTLSPVEVTKTVLARLEPKINAFVLVAATARLLRPKRPSGAGQRGPWPCRRRARHHQRSLPHQRMYRRPSYYATMSINFHNGDNL